MRTLFALLRAYAPRVVAPLLVAPMLATGIVVAGVAYPAHASPSTRHVVFSHTASDVVTTPARTPRTAAVLLTPTAQDLSNGGTAHLTYSGPGTRLGAIYFDGQLLDSGAMQDALCTGDVIDLPWAWFGDTIAHRVVFRVYASDYVVGAVLPTYTDAYAVTATITVEPFTPVTTFTAPNLGPLQVGEPVNVTVDLGTLATGFDWSYGGSLDVSGLPSGLTFALANPSTDDNQWSTDGTSPQLRVSGTPTSAGVRSVVFAVADGFSAMALANRTYTVAPSPKAPTAPAPRTLSRAGRSTFTITGLTANAVITPAVKSRGIKTIGVNRNTVTIESLGNFSGVIRQRVTITDQGLTTTLSLVLQVRPAAPLHVTVSPAIGRTTVRWGASANATGYRVLVNGKQAARLTAAARAYVVKATLNARSTVQVIATGGDGLTSAAARAARVR
jgi:hypothetical protein